MSVIKLGDWKDIPTHLQAHYEGGWSDPGPVTIEEDYIPPDHDLSEEELSQKTKAQVFIYGESAKYWLEKLPMMIRLQALFVVGSVINHKLLEKVTALPNLLKLKLDKTTSKDLSSVSNLTKLTHLCLAYSNNFSSIFDHLNSQDLTSLSLGLPAGSGSLAKITQLENLDLRYLMLGSCAESNYSVLDSLEPLTTLSSLEYVSLSNIKAKDKRLSVLRSMPNLKVIELAAPEWWDTKGLK